MELLALTNGYAVYRMPDGATIAQPIEQDARMVLNWNARNIPVNDK